MVGNGFYMAEREESWSEVVSEGGRELNGSQGSVMEVMGEEHSPHNDEMICSNLENEGNFLDCFRGIPDSKGWFCPQWASHHTLSIQGGPEALWKAWLAVRHLSMHPSPAMSLRGDFTRHPAL